MTDPDIQREWLLSKWERFTDDELDCLRSGLFGGDMFPTAASYPTAWPLDQEITSEIARRQADAEAAEEDA